MSCLGARQQCLRRALAAPSATAVAARAGGDGATAGAFARAARSAGCQKRHCQKRHWKEHRVGLDAMCRSTFCLQSKFEGEASLLARLPGDLLGVFSEHIVC